MRISDWSSDVCSSDLLDWTIDTIPPVSRTYDMRSQMRMICDRIVDLANILPKVQPLARAGPVMRVPSQQRPCAGESDRSASAVHQIGRASCRERVCQYV